METAKEKNEMAVKDATHTASTGQCMAKAANAPHAHAGRIRGSEKVAWVFVQAAMHNI